jgi:hypothetical protein
VKQHINDKADSESEEENLYGASKRLKFDHYIQNSQGPDKDSILIERERTYA